MSEPSQPAVGGLGDAPLTPTGSMVLRAAVLDRAHWNQAFLLHVPADLDARRARHRAGGRRGAATTCSGCASARTSTAGSPDTCRRIRGPAVERVDLRDYPAEMVSTAIESAAASAQAGLDITRRSHSRGPCISRAPPARRAGCSSSSTTSSRMRSPGGCFSRISSSAYGPRAPAASPSLPNRTTSFKFWAERLVGYANSGRARRVWRAGAGRSTREPRCLPRDHDGRSRAEHRRLDGHGDGVADGRGNRRAAAIVRLRRTGREVDDLLLSALAQALEPWTGRDDVLVDVEDQRGAKTSSTTWICRGRSAGSRPWYPVHLEMRRRVAAPLIKRTKETLRRLHHRGLSFGALRYLSPDAEVRKALEAVPRPQLLFKYLADARRDRRGFVAVHVRRRVGGPWRADENRRSHLLEVVALVTDGRLKVQWTLQQALPRRRDDFDGRRACTRRRCASSSITA